MNVRPLVIAMILAGLVTSVLLFARAVPSNVFDYDESDYMYAVSKGFHANCLDEPSIPMGTFIDAGLHGVRGQSGPRLALGVHPIRRRYQFLSALSRAAVILLDHGQPSRDGRRGDGPPLDADGLRDAHLRDHLLGLPLPRPCHRRGWRRSPRRHSTC